MTLEPINQSFLPEDAPEKHARLWPRLGRAIRKDLGTACLEPTSHDKCCFSCIIHVVCNTRHPFAGELTACLLWQDSSSPAEWLQQGGTFVPARSNTEPAAMQVSAQPGKPGRASSFCLYFAESCFFSDQVCPSLREEVGHCVVVMVVGPGMNRRWLGDG